MTLPSNNIVKHVFMSYVSDMVLLLEQLPGRIRFPIYL